MERVGIFVPHRWAVLSALDAEVHVWVPANLLQKPIIKGKWFESGDVDCRLFMADYITLWHEQDREMIPVLLFRRAAERNLLVAEFVRILIHMGILTNSADQKRTLQPHA